MLPMIETELFRLLPAGRSWLVTLLVFVAAVRTDAAEAHSHRFDFGTGPVANGWLPVEPECELTPVRGYGFQPGATVQALKGDSSDAVRADGITSAQPFLFSVVLPEGNYDVTLTFGDSISASTNTVKAESRRLMLGRVVTQPGEFIMRTITVNVRTPAIPGGGAVRLKDREQGVLHWDDKLTIEFDGSRPAMCGMEILPATNAVTVYLLGDSTVTDQPREPWNSWGQMLTRFFKPGVAVANHAESGESLKGSLRANRVAKVLSSIGPGDYLFVQFGHNDMKDRATNALEIYKANLKQLVADVSERDATPVLVTSMERSSGVEKDTLSGYPQTVRDVAREEGVALIDLHAMSRTFYRALGSNLKAAFQDGTHHNAYGSYQLAKCVVMGIRQSDLPLAKFVTEDFGSFDPAHPDSLATFDIPPSKNVSIEKPDGN